jgi:hypothetical protein
MFPMKTTAKTIFSLMAAGFVLTTISARSIAQSSDTAPAPEKPLSPQIMKILCERSPLNSRCAQGSAPDSAGSASSESPSPSTSPDPSMSSPSPSASPDPSMSSPMPTTSPDPSMPAPATGSPAGGGTLPPTGTDPSVPAPATGDPAGGGTLPSTSTPVAPAEAPGTMPKP